MGGASGLAMSPAIAMISAMITPALLILASGSLIASALVRMARSVDRARALITMLENPQTRGVIDAVSMRRWLDRHETRSIAAERATMMFFCAVTVFVVACLAIALDRLSGERLTWLPVTLVIVGMILLVVGSGLMIYESRLGGLQIREEIARGRKLLSP